MLHLFSSFQFGRILNGGPRWMGNPSFLFILKFFEPNNRWRLSILPIPFILSVMTPTKYKVSQPWRNGGCASYHLHLHASNITIYIFDGGVLGRLVLWFLSNEAYNTFFHVEIHVFYKFLLHSRISELKLFFKE